MSSPNLTSWQRRVEEMKRFTVAAELAGKFGMPPHKVKHGETEFWHYPLGIEGGFLYSIHAAIAGDQVSQVYLHLEPSGEARTAERIPWWGRIFRRTTAKSEPRPRAKPIESRLVLTDQALYTIIAAASPTQRRHAAAALARWAVSRSGLKNATIDQALARLNSHEPQPANFEASLDKAVEELDAKHGQLAEQEEVGKASAEAVASAFSQARAADAVVFALAGDAAETAYEVTAATDDLPEVKRIVLEALAESRGA